MSAGAAAVVLAVGTTAAVAVLTADEGGSGDEAAVWTGFEVRYSPTWLPPGLKEVGRMSSTPDVANTNLVRTWSWDPVGPDGVMNGARLELTIWRAGNAASSAGEPVDINGHPGRYGGPPDGTTNVLGGMEQGVEWRPDDQTVLHLTDFARMSRQDLLRIARSFRPDPGRLTVPLHVDWLPGTMHQGYAWTAGGSPTSWRSQLSFSERYTVTDPDGENGRPNPADTQAKLNSRALEVSIGTVSPAPAGGEVVTIGDHPARLLIKHFPEGAYPRLITYIVVDLGLGLPLTVAGWGVWSRGDMLRIAENVRVDRVPDLSWLGA
jgi:hypothetical protein